MIYTMGRRVLIILLCAGLIAGGLYAFSMTSAAQSLAAMGGRGDHGPPRQGREAGSDEECGQARGSEMQQRPPDHTEARQRPPEHAERASLLDTLLSIGAHVGQIALITVVVMLLGKGTRAWHSRRKRGATRTSTSGSE